MRFRRLGRAAALSVLAAVALALPLAATAQDRTGGVSSQPQPGEPSAKRDKLAYFDARTTPAAEVKLRAKAQKLAASPNAATVALRESLGNQGIVSIDPLTTTPRMVGRLDGFLTPPSGASASAVALGYVEQHGDAFGLSTQAIRNLTLVRDYVDVDGTHHLFYLQKVNGIPVFDNGLKANVTKDGRLINVVGSPVSSLSVATTSPRVSAGNAVASARQDAEESVPPVRIIPGRDARQTTVFSSGDRASLVLFQGVDGLRLGWQTLVSGGSVSFMHVIDAATGQILYRRSLVNYANGLVYENYPGAAVGGTQVVKSISNPGWLTSSTILQGNNTHVYADVDDSNDSTNSSPLTEPEEISPSGGGNWLYPVTPFTFVGSLNTDYGCDTSLCTWNPSFTGDASNPSGDYSYQVNRSQSGTQLFYLINNYHDHLLASPIGFTEAAGNFQQVNSTHRGLGGDPVQGETLDGANSYTFGFPDPLHTDNANFATPPDGIPPRMQMYLWHDTTADFFGGPTADPFLPADGANEADIVYHEYTHGLSNRLVVDALGNSTLGNVQAGSMGEAWSDWYAMDFLVKEGFFTDTAADGELRIGAYVGRNQDLIRTQPIDCPVGSTSPSCPGDLDHAGGYTYGDYGRIIGIPEVHADGEIWGETLWDLRTALPVTAKMKKKNLDNAERLITRAMELAPDNPSFLDMRNAILQADLVAGGGLQNTIWTVFAHRGMGYFAGTLDGDDTAPVEDFSMPPGPSTPRGNMVGTVSDQDTGAPIHGAVVAFGGHDSGFQGNLVATTGGGGSYKLKKVVAGTYPDVNASAAGFDRSVATVTIAPGTLTQNWVLRRDWASIFGGASVFDFNGPDYTDFGCGPSGAIDQGSGSGWGSTTDDDLADITGNTTPKFVVIELPTPVDVSEIAVNPSNTCGDPGSSSTRGYRVETSTDGSTFTPLTDGVFYLGNRGQLNTVFSGSAAGVRYVRFWMLNPQVPQDPDPNAACTGPADCGTDPDDASGVTTHCTSGADQGFGGCQFMDMSEIEVYGRPSS
jgi:extracellular elastinolytic metalloproteinase